MAEALARSGVGALDLIDSDVVSESNLNRQIYALRSTIGRYKVDVAKERIADINPGCRVTVYKMFYLPENSASFDFTKYDYIIDAVDTVTAKIELIMQAKKCGTPIISSMGAGNKLGTHPFEVSDIYSTSVCPLAKVMRRELKKREIAALKVVYSKETPISVSAAGDEGSSKRAIPGSTAFVPALAGMTIAAEVVRDLTVNKEMFR